MELIEILEDIRDMLLDELECVRSKGQLTQGTLDVVEKLTHSLKSIESVIAMYEYEDNGYSGYSQRNNMRYDSYSYANGRGNRGGGRSNRNYEGNSRSDYAYRGSRNSRNNSRYSREDEKEKMVDDLKEYMDKVDSDKVRDSIQKVISQLESEG